MIHAARPLKRQTRELIFESRAIIESYIRQWPVFAETLVPWRIQGPAPEIIRDMTAAGQQVAVGPMAAVAGAVAEHVGTGLLQYSKQVIVENGGDVFLKTDQPSTIAIFAGKSSLSMRIGFRVSSAERPISVCTSSGTIGHSLSFGRADAVCVVSPRCSLADAAATAIGNRVSSKKNISSAIDFGKHIDGILGIAVIVDDALGLWGELEVVPLQT